MIQKNTKMLMGSGRLTIRSSRSTPKVTSSSRDVYGSWSAGIAWGRACGLSSIQHIRPKGWDSRFRS